MKTKGILGAVLTLALALAGCAGIEDETAGGNEAPNADLQASKDTAWIGETIAFDAQASDDSDGEIVTYRFDFGDGTMQEATDEENARVQHAYAEGGEYTVTVTVTDDGAEDAGALTDTASVVVHVNDREHVTGSVFTTPVGNETSTFTRDVNVSSDVDRFEVEISVRGTTLSGSSEVAVRFLDADGDVVAEETLTVAAQEEEDVLLEDLILDSGLYKVEVEAMSGSASFDGEARIYY